MQPAAAALGGGLNKAVASRYRPQQSGHATMSKPFLSSAALPLLLGVVLTCSGLRSTASGETPPAVERWLGPQEWQRDTDGPVLSLGGAGQFDDMHIFAPTVVRENDRFSMWYCGSTGTARDLAGRNRVPDERVFKLGLATSADGRSFERHAGPVMELADDRRSILTPCVLRTADGTPIREQGKLRMWFTSAAFRGDRVHTIHHATSAGGIEWDEPSQPLLENAYCPSVVKTASGYRMWFTDVTKFPWVVRHARSDDGLQWSVTPEPVLDFTQPWEHHVLVYPTVIEVDGLYLMWYGSYSESDRQKTSIGFAVSEDGLTWYKHPANPVLGPDAGRPWESHYVTSESVIRLPDGSFRIWYASRKAPPFMNLYFALNTARWEGPAAVSHQ
jgi:predicted GH43/DUF377 family glycosyl hydrolase